MRIIFAGSPDFSVPVLKSFELDIMDNGELLVKNPPPVSMPHVKPKQKIYTGNEDA